MGWVLKTLGEYRGFTQGEAAKRVGVTTASVSMLEGSVKRNPSLAVLKRLAKALGVPVAAPLESPPVSAKGQEA